VFKKKTMKKWSAWTGGAGGKPKKKKAREKQQQLKVYGRGKKGVFRRGKHDGRRTMREAAFAKENVVKKKKKKPERN